MDAEAEELMRAHYAALPSEGRRSGKCAMSIPAGLYGARVLDVCCRAGKGAYDLSDHVGAEGFVLGIDPNPSRIERAISHASDNHWAGSAWPAYLRFQCAYPEDLALAGARDSSFDLIYVNCELNVVWNLPLALSEFARVLKSGGRLWVAQGVFRLDGIRPCPDRSSGESAFAHDVEASGSIFAQARTRSAFEELCLEAGFRSCAFGAGEPAVADGCDVIEGIGSSSFVTCDACVTL